MSNTGFIQLQHKPRLFNVRIFNEIFIDLASELQFNAFVNYNLLMVSSWRQISSSVFGNLQL